MIFYDTRIDVSFDFYLFINDHSSLWVENVAQ